MSRGQDLSPDKAARFASEVALMQQRWGEQLMQDPAYNPNLCLDNSQFQLSRPPRLERWPVPKQELKLNDL